VTSLRGAALSVLLAVLYIVVFIPLGIGTRLLRDPLRRRPDRSAASYWPVAVSNK
jgi:hypothetical protein